MLQNISSFASGAAGMVYNAGSKCVNTAANIVKPIASTGLDCISGTASLAKTTTAMYGACVTGVFAFDSYQHLNETNHYWNRLNPCNRTLPTTSNMFSSSYKQMYFDEETNKSLIAYPCETWGTSEMVADAFNEQMLLLPFVPVITFLACTAFGKIEKGAADLSARISGRV